MPLAWLDVIPYIMANFASVKDTVAFLLSDAVQASMVAQPPGIMCARRPALHLLPAAAELAALMSQPNAAPTLPRTQVSTSLPPMHYQQVLAALGFKQHQVPLHLALMDASGDAALIEYTSKGVGCCLGSS